MSHKDKESHKSDRKKKQESGESSERGIVDNCGCFQVVDACGCRVVDPCGCHVSTCCC